MENRERPIITLYPTPSCKDVRLLSESRLEVTADGRMWHGKGRDADIEWTEINEQQFEQMGEDFWHEGWITDNVIDVAIDLSDEAVIREIEGEDGDEE